MKKILIISYLFPPENRIGALRAAKLSKFLSKDDFIVDILTKDFESRRNPIKYHKNYNDINSIIRVAHSNKPLEEDKEKIQTRSQNNTVLDNKSIFKGLIPNSIKSNYRQLLSILKSVNFYRKVKKYISINKEQFTKYDAVISTYGPLSSHLCGNYINKNFETKWICDFRDPMTSRLNGFTFNFIYSLLQKYFCNNADYVTTVSKGYLNRIVNKKQIHKSKVIPNGYDLEDKPNRLTSKGFSFTYVGSLYEGKRKVTPLFKSIRILIDTGIILKDDFIFNYAGSDFNYIFDQAKTEGLQDNLINKGKLPRNECIELQSESRFLVLTTWNYKKEAGVFPGKFLEYMLMEKPIIALIDGDCPDSEIKGVMSKVNLGLTYEEVNKNRDLDSLINYISQDYIRFKNSFSPNFKPDTFELDKYNYEYISNQFREIL